MKIALLETETSGSKGSMRAYAELVTTSLRSQGLDVQRLSLAPLNNLLNSLPGSWNPLGKVFSI